MADSELKKIKEKVLEFLKDQEVAVLLFGSRARGNAPQGSDIDIGLIPQKRFDPRKLILLREFLENLNTPFKVDLITGRDFS
jgi:uncharacterized protein